MKKRKKVLAMLMVLTMVVSMLPMPGSILSADAETGLCPHHQMHDGSCGYVEAVEGSPCTHVHDAACGYTEATPEIPCSCAANEDGEIIHGDGCTYTPASEGTPCGHVHDADCGYVEAVEGAPCQYECALCAFAQAVAALDGEALIKAAADLAVPEQTITADDLAGAEDFAELFALLERYEAMNEADQADEVVSAAYADLQTLLTAVVEAANGQTPEKPPIAGLMGALSKETGNTVIEKPEAKLLYANGDPVEGNDELSKDTPLKLKLHWDDIENVNYGQEYTIELPEILRAAADTVNDQPIELITTTYHFADGKYEMDTTPVKIGTWCIADSKLVISFVKETFYIEDADGEFVMLETNNAKDVTITYDVSLEIDKAQENDKGQVEIALPDGTTVSVIITELKPAGPTLAKTVAAESNGSFDDKGNVTWQITYTAPTQAWQDDTANTGKVPTQLIDTLPAGLAYVENSFRCEAGDENSAITLTVPGDAENAPQPNTLVFDVSKATPGVTYTLIYQTKLTDQELYNLWVDTSRTEKKYTNTVQAYNEENTLDLKASADAVMPSDYGGRVVIQKNGAQEAIPVYNDDTGLTDYYLKWEVTVNTMGQQFKTLNLLDIQGKGLTLFQGVELYTGDAIETATDSITAPTLNGNPLDMADDYAYYPSDGDGKELAAGSSQEPCIHTMKVPLVKEGENVHGDDVTIYKLVYFTKMDSRYITGWKDNALTEDDYKNVATLEWEWQDGYGPGGAHKPPKVEKKPGHSHIKTELIQKSYVNGKYDPQQRNRHWKVTVNPAHIQLYSVTLIEDLTQTPAKEGISKYEPHSFTRTKVTAFADVDGVDADAALAAIESSVERGLKDKGIENAVVKVTFPEEDNDAHKKLQIDITGLNSTADFSFEFDTYYDLTEEDTLPTVTSNDDHWVNNRVTLAQYQTDAEKDPVKPNISKDAQARTYQTVVEKKAAAYDPAAKKLTWAIKMNDHWEAAYAPMSKVALTDTLPAGLSYVKDSAKVSVAGSSKVNENLPTADQLQNELHVKTEMVGNQQQITFTFGEEQQIPKGTILSFETKVDIDGIADFQTEGEVSLTNQVTLTCAQNPEGIETEGQCVIINRPLQKGTESTTNGRKVDYIVQINPLGADLSKLIQDEQIEKLIMKDTLSKGLFLDTDSVKVYAGDVSTTPEGINFKPQVNKKDEPLSGITPEYDQTKNTFTLALPEVDQPYVVTYTAYVTAAANITLQNDVMLVGLKQIAGQEDSHSHKFTFSSSATATLSLPNSYCTLVVNKKNTDGTLIDKPATFGLYADPDCQNLLARSETIGGKCTFVLRKNDVRDKVLYLRELQAPEGYQLLKEPIKIDGRQVVDGTYEENVVNTEAPTDPQSAQLTLTKTVSGAADPTKAYHFTISLTDAATDEPINAKYGDVDFAHGVADIALKGSESCTITIDNLSGALKYTITEKGAQDYTVTTSGDLTSGLLAAGDVLSVTFDNYLKPHNGGGGGGGGSDVPPVTPDNPNPPVDPDKPDKPIPPVTPEVPVTPETPVTPTDPDTPNVPDTPGVPDVPVYYPGDELPDPTDPNSPDEIIIMDGDVPLHYWKTEEPPIVYIDEEGVPLAGLPQPDAVPHTGDTMDTTVWWSIFAVALGLCALTTMLGIRRKYKTK